MRQELQYRTLPISLRESYRSALIRASIASVIVFVLVSRGAAAASPNAAPSGTPAEEAATPRPLPGGAPSQPFSDGGTFGARGGDDESASASGGDDAEAEAEETDEEEPGSPLRTLSCLEGEGGNDNDGARRGVQKRDFMKKRRLEIAALGGYFASDALSSTYIYGGALSFFPSEDFGLELLVARNPVAFRLEQPFNSFDREQHFQSSVAWNVLGALLWSPVHAKLRWSERHITHADLLLVAGAGQTSNDSVQGLTFQAGMGIKLYLARFVSLRIDVRDLIIPQEVLGRGRATHNVVTMLGLCAWVPG